FVTRRLAAIFTIFPTRRSSDLLEHRTYVALRHREDDRIRLGSDREEQTWESALGQVAPGAVRGWGAYPAGVAWALAQEGHDTGGARKSTRLNSSHVSSSYAGFG